MIKKLDFNINITLMFLLYTPCINIYQNTYIKKQRTLIFHYFLILFSYLSKHSNLNL